MSENDMIPKNLFFIDIHPKGIKWGMDIRPLIVGDHSLYVSKKAIHYGFKRVFLKEPGFGLGVIRDTNLDDIGKMRTDKINEVFEKEYGGDIKKNHPLLG